MIPSYESIAVFENFFGEELDADILAKLADMPDYQLKELCARLDQSFKSWFLSKNNYLDASTLTIPPFQPVYSHDANLQHLPRLEHWLKCSLLYYPGAVAIPDPLGAGEFLGHLDYDRDYQDYTDREIRILQYVRNELIDGLRLSLRLRPLVDAGALITMPFPAIMHLNTEAMNAAQGAPFEHLANHGVFTLAELSAYRSLTDQFWIYDEDTDDYFPEMNDLLAAEWLWVGVHLGHSPVAADATSLRLMKTDLEGGNAALSDKKVAELISRFRVPSADKATLDEVVKLRLNDEAFAGFRATFEAILSAVCQADPKDESAFSTEYRRHAYGMLVKEREQLERHRRNSDVLQQILTGAFLLGAAGIEAAVTKDAPIGSILGAGATLGGWLVPYLSKRVRMKETDELIRTFFSYLMPAEGGN